jgi:micrococcal nuclease
MNLNKYDFLVNHISNQTHRLLVYFFLTSIVAMIFTNLGFSIVLSLIVMFIAYKKINDEKIKWGVIGILTLAILVINNQPKNNQEKAKENIKEEKITIDSKSNEMKEQTDQKIDSAKEEIFLVTRVVDGDTIEIEGGKRVRYIGIDTPETVDPNRPVGCFGKEASNKNSELVLNKKVKLIKDVSETDKYGRLLRYVYVENTFVNDYLVSEGYAKASTYAPDVKFSEQFVNSERKAREEKKGLWSDTCEIKTQSSIITSIPSVYIAPAIGGEAPVVQKPIVTNEVSSSGIVKKSSTGICHAPGTTYYNKTKNFVAYNSVQACLDSGGRLPLR